MKSRATTATGSHFIFITTTLCCASAISGCRSHTISPLPHYALTGPQETLAAFTARASGVTSVQADAVIELTDAKRQTVHLDAALLLQAPDKVRLRAWKFGTAVFDLTVRGEKAWAFVPRDEARPAMPAARQSITQWLGLLQGKIDQPTRLTSTDNLLIVDAASSDGLLRCTIDRPTLTAQKYELFDSGGGLRFTLALADYAQQAGGPAGIMVWPMTITATSEQGVIAVRCNEVAINEALPPTAFDPPARAEALP